MTEPVVLDLVDACMQADEAVVALWYPRNPGGVHTVTVGLYDVRAADDLTIRYDFDRDGYSITREIKRAGDGIMKATGVWREVAFVSAWTEDPGTTTVTLPPTLHEGCATDGGGGPITITSTRINAGPTLRATCSHGRTFVILNGAWEEVR